MSERFMTKMRAARLRKGWTGKDLGERMFLCSSRLSLYEHGECRIPPNNADRLGKLLGIAPECLQEMSDIPEENSPELGARVRAARLEAGLTQRQVEIAIGYGQNLFWRLEAGQRVGPHALLKVWDYFGMRNDR